jgi:hypothetical protein
MRWEPSDVNLVYSIGSFGQYMGFLPGGVFDKLGAKAISFYSMLGGLGYFCIWLQVSTQFTDSPIVMGFFLACSGTGSLGMYYAGLLTSTKNFDVKHNGKIVGTLAAGFGLSAKLFTLIYEAVDEDVELYLLLVAAVLMGVSILSVLIIKVIPPGELGGLVSTDYKTVNDSDKAEFGEPLNAALLGDGVIYMGDGDSEEPADGVGGGGFSATAAEEGLLTTKLSPTPEELQSGCATFTKPEYIFMTLVFCFSVGAGVMVIGELGM